MLVLNRLSRMGFHAALHLTNAVSNLVWAMGLSTNIVDADPNWKVFVKLLPVNCASQQAERSAKRKACSATDNVPHSAASRGWEPLRPTFRVLKKAARTVAYLLVWIGLQEPNHNNWGERSVICISNRVRVIEARIHSLSLDDWGLWCEEPDTAPCHRMRTLSLTDCGR